MGLGGTTRSAQAFSTFSASFFGVFGIEMVSSYLFTSTFPLHGARLDFVFVCVPCGHPLLLDATALRPLSSALFQPAHTRLYSLLSLSSGEFTVVSPPIGVRRGSLHWRIRRFPGTSGGLVGFGGLSLVYLSTLSLGGATRIE